MSQHPKEAGAATGAGSSALCQGASEHLYKPKVSFPCAPQLSSAVRTTEGSVIALGDCSAYPLSAGMGLLQGAPGEVQGGCPVTSPWVMLTSWESVLR